MCGIAGIISLNKRPVEPSRLTRMIDSLSHRGPDGEGKWVRGPVGLGHRRLAVLDLSESAAQPMTTADGRFVLTFNGEIYNYRSLREELRRDGFQFSTNSDTEVVLNSIAAWGPSSISRMNGMFAFAIWDTREQTLMIARDRYGIKPLYVSVDRGELQFGSEVKAILASDSSRRNLDKDALAEYLTFQNFFTSSTLWDGVQVFPPGHYAVVDLLNEHKGLRLQQYWDFDFNGSTEVKSEREWAEELGRLLGQAVNRQLVADVEVGAFLSGGIDSGSVVSYASQSIANLKTFTIGFDTRLASGIEQSFDERATAERVASAFRTEHYEMILRPGDMQRCLPGLVHHLEEPRVGQSYPNFYAAKLASKFVKVALAGTGGDELFGGYPWRYFHSEETGSLSEYVSNYYTYWQRLLSEEEKSRLLLPSFPSKDLPDTRQIFSSVLAKAGNGDLSRGHQLNAALYLEAKTFLHSLLIVEDKLSMAHGLETRVPFLDNDVVDFALKCPPELKIPRTGTGTVDENNSILKSAASRSLSAEGKHILRLAASPRIPDYVINGRKIGFTAPDASWFRGESIQFVESVLFTPGARLYEALDFDTTRDLVDDHLSGRRNRRLLIWSLLSLEFVLQEYF